MSRAQQNKPRAPRTHEKGWAKDELLSGVLIPMKTAHVDLPLELYDRLRGVAELRSKAEGVRGGGPQGVSSVITDIVKRYVDDYEAGLSK